METKWRKNKNKIMMNAGKGVERLEMKFVGNTCRIQFTSTGKKRKYFMNDMQKLAVDVTFTHMTDNKGIKNRGQRAVAAMYKEYITL